MVWLVSIIISHLYVFAFILCNIADKDNTFKPIAVLTGLELPLLSGYGPCTVRELKGLDITKAFCVVSSYSNHES